MAEEKRKGRGGRREGSGRKPHPGVRMGIMLHLPEEVAQKLRAQKNKSAYVSALIVTALCGEQPPNG